MRIEIKTNSKAAKISIITRFALKPDCLMCYQKIKALKNLECIICSRQQTADTQRQLVGADKAKWMERRTSGNNLVPSSCLLQRN